MSHSDVAEPGEEGRGRGDPGARGGASGSRPSTYRRDPRVPAVQIEHYPRRSPTVEARLARLAQQGPVRYEDFFFPPSTWRDLEERTARSCAERRGRGPGGSPP